ncbi:MAG: hypothetical protein N4A46_06590 [Schleiferiaceae bacterium]|jgi:uncharacterized membrane protein|nr:hypothetical protein [Schleiferiaceae bacterium]
MLRDFFEGLGAFLEWTFGILKFFGNSVNVVFSVIIFLALLYWFREMIKHQKAGEN